MTLKTSQAEKLEDRLTSRHVRLLRVANGEMRSLGRFLAGLDRDLLREVLGIRGAAAFRRELIKGNRLNLEAAAKRLLERLLAVASIEAEFATALIGGEVVPTEATLHRVLQQQVHGETMVEWLRRVRDSRRRDVTEIVVKAAKEGTPRAAVAREVRRALQLGRQRLQSVTRTLTVATANRARHQAYRQNADQLEALIWNSVLDGNTTIRHCVPRAGLLYRPNGTPLGHVFSWGGGPGNIHFGCRSFATPWLKDTERPETPNFQTFLKRNPRLQEEVLGTRRAQLFRQGKLSVKRFFDDRGRFLTLDQLKRL